MTGSTSSDRFAQPSLIRAMGRWSLTAAIVNGVIGSGIFGLPSAVAALTGAWSPLAVLIAGACVFVVLLCFAEVGSRFDEAGGPYLYAREAFGPIVGFQVGWLLLVSRLLALRGRAEHSHRLRWAARAAVATSAGRAITMTGAIADGHGDQRHGRAPGGMDDERVHRRQAAATSPADRARVAADPQRRARHTGRRTP